MDDESTQLLREIRDLQKEQFELLRAWFPPQGPRFRFSLRTLLVALTVAAILLGIAVVLAKIGNANMRTTTKPAVPVTKK
jgi:hypothetical protein